MLSSGNSVKVTEMDSKKYEQRLSKRRNELVQRLMTIEDRLDDPKDADFSERAVQSEEDEVLQLQGTSGEQEINAIDAALTRIEEGTFGTCTSCGAEISEARLDIVPYTAVCRNCMKPS